MFAAEERDIYSIILHLLTPGRLFAPLVAKRSHEYPSSVLLPEPDGDSTRFADVSQYEGKAFLRPTAKFTGLGRQGRESHERQR